MRNLLSLVVLTTLLGFASAEDLPVFSLPWGKYEGEVSAKDEHVIIFRNVRFGAEPQRFGAPSFPDWTDDSIQNPNKNTTCIQINPAKLENPPGGRHPIEDPHKVPAAQTEDCLFLDIYVPKWVFAEPEDTTLPVVVWIYGGGYAFGAKDQGGPLYTGLPLLRASNYQSIFITGNYRVGAFGWLAGDYMQKAGQPNAGLYDQELLFEWVQRYVKLVHGDKEAVSAWGQSAGAGSILHHLIREGGTKDPLFHTFAAQSPGFEWAWDNSPGGKLDTIYRNFSRLAGCEFDYNIGCLRKAKVEDLAKANQELFRLVRQTGLFPVGPAVDGKWVQTLSPIAFSEGKYWKEIFGTIVSHVANEGELFTPQDMDSEAKYDQYLNEYFPGPSLAPQREAIKRQYDCKNDYDNYRVCVASIIAHAVFTCNTRDLATAYPDNTYMLAYEFPFVEFSLHGTDLIPGFMSDAEEAKKLLIELGLSEFLAEIYATFLDSLIKSVYQTYFASFGTYRDPNTLNNQEHWPVVNGKSEEFGSVLRAKLDLLRPSWDFINDKNNSKPICTFWSGIAKDIVGSKSTYGDTQSLQLELQFPLSPNEL